jgi:hypothetical protein
MRKRVGRILGSVALVMVMTSPGFPQQELRPGGVPVKLQVVLTRGEGDKKVRESHSVVASSSGETTSLRIGHEVPVSTTGPNGQTLFSYQQIGTQIDASVTAITGADRYKVQITVTKRKASDNPVAAAPQGASPTSTFSSFIFAGTLLLRNGETAPIIATDLVTNETWQADLTLSAEK